MSLPLINFAPIDKLSAKFPSLTETPKPNRKSKGIESIRTKGGKTNNKTNDRLRKTEYRKENQYPYVCMWKRNVIKNFRSYEITKEEKRNLTDLFIKRRKKK